MWGLCHRQTRWMGKDADGLRLHDEQTQDKTRPKTINERTSSRSNSLCSFPNVKNTTPHLAITNDRPSLAIFIRRLSRVQIHHHLFSVSSDVEERV